MFAYWMLLTFFAVGALLERPRTGLPQAAGYVPAGGQPNSGTGRIIYSPMLVFGALVIIAMIGLRYKVGGDWDNYIRIFFNTTRLSFATAMERGDPGYQAINWAVAHFGYKIWVVNLICGAIFGFGLLRFCATQPRPWLAFAIAIPYLVIVVAMGYTRQAVALGILMAGLAQAGEGRRRDQFRVLRRRRRAVPFDRDHHFSSRCLVGPWQSLRQRRHRGFGGHHVLPDVPGGHDGPADRQLSRHSLFVPGRPGPRIDEHARRHLLPVGRQKAWLFRARIPDVAKLLARRRGDDGASRRASVVDRGGPHFALPPAAAAGGARAASRARTGATARRP